MKDPNYNMSDSQIHNDDYSFNRIEFKQEIRDL